MHLLITPRSTVLKLASIAAGFVIVGVMTAYLRIVHGLELAQLVWLFDLSADRAFPTWYASLMLLTASLLAFVAATDRAGHVQVRDRRSWTALGVVLLFLSADETAGSTNGQEIMLRNSRDTLTARFGACSTMVGSSSACFS